MAKKTTTIPASTVKPMKKPSVPDSGCAACGMMNRPMPSQMPMKPMGGNYGM